jgi:hypothetical protein
MTDDLTPEAARDIDYALRKQRFACLFGASVAWCVAALLLVVRPIVVGLAVGVGGTAVFLAIWLIVSTALRKELRPFIDPSTGELSIPGGRRTLTAREALITLYWSKGEDGLLFGGLLVAALLLLGALLISH